MSTMLNLKAKNIKWNNGNGFTARVDTLRALTTILNTYPNTERYCDEIRVAMFERNKTSIIIKPETIEWNEMPFCNVDIKVDVFDVIKNIMLTLELKPIYVGLKTSTNTDYHYCFVPERHCVEIFFHDYHYDMRELVDTILLSPENTALYNIFTNLVKTIKNA